MLMMLIIKSGDKCMEFVLLFSLFLYEISCNKKMSKNGEIKW